MMKNIQILSAFILILGLFLFIPSNVNAQDKSNRVEVIDFHTTHRCMTCEAIEANTKYTLQTFFAKEVENGTLTMDVINIDAEENEAIAEKFQVYGTSLFLNVIINEKETKIDLTEFAFMKGTDQDAFSKELSIKIKRELRKL